MSGLLDKEEEDEFYKTTYGGFDDVGDDTEFNYNSPAEEEDEVDSDFSIDENAVIACAPPVSDFEPMYFALDRQKRNFISCDNIKATALDPGSNSFEFEGLIFTSRIKKAG